MKPEGRINLECPNGESKPISSLPLPRSGRQEGRANNWVLFLLVIALVCPLVYVGVAIVLQFAYFGPERIRRSQVELLYKVDHQVILEASRLVHANAASFRTDPSWNGAQGVVKDYLDPQDPQIPPVISALSPKTVKVEADHLRIELGGGDYHYGLRAYLPGFRTSGTRELAEGLWYYADDNFVPPREDSSP